MIRPEFNYRERISSVATENSKSGELPIMLLYSYERSLSFPDHSSADELLMVFLLLSWFVWALPSTGSYDALHGGASACSWGSPEDLRSAARRIPHLYIVTLHLGLCVSQLTTTRTTTVSLPRRTVEVLLFPSVANETRDSFEIHLSKVEKEGTSPWPPVFFFWVFFWSWELMSY